jgi:polysaccharide biosynthesis protein PelA
MKKWLLIMAIFTFGFFSLHPKHSSAQSGQSTLQQVKNYKIYYSAPTDRILKKLSSYDLVVIEPQLYTKEQIQYLQQNGTIVLGYISVMETPTWNKQRLELLADSDYFKRSGARVHYEQWDSYLMDIASVHYHKVLMDEMERQVNSKGMNGVFFDTVGNIDNEHLENNAAIYKKQLDGLLAFLDKSDRKFPNLLMVQNWGMETIQHTHKYMDGFMWEGFDYNEVSTDEWAQNQISKLKKIQQMGKTQIMTVSTKLERKSKNYAEKFNFLHYHDKKSYDVF